MLDPNILQIILGTLSALILFIYAIDNLSTELQELASEKFHKFVSKIVSNKYLGTAFGALSTAIVQSSSAITITTIALVNIGIIPFSQSLPVILGSNIGTTVTAQLALLNSTVFASGLIIIGFLIGALGKKYSIISKPIFFLGFILFSLSLLSNSIDPLKENPNIISFFSQLSNPLIAYISGILFTGLVQSSSITSGIVVILTQSGLIPVEVAIPMVLGANLGSSITGLIASLGLNVHAKRVGFANFFFNAIGTVIFMILIKPFTFFIQYLSDTPSLQVALAHLLFNLLNSFLFLIFINYFEKLVKIFIKGNEEEILFKTKYLNGTKKKKLKRRIDDIENEIAYSVENSIKIFQESISVFYNPSKLTLMNIQKLETLNDFLDDEITEHIVKLSKFKLSPKYAHKTVTLIKISNTIEMIGDLGEDLADVFSRMHSFGIDPKGVGIEKLTNVHSRLILLYKDIQENILDPEEKKLLAVKAKEEEIYELIRYEFDTHVIRLQGDDKYEGSIFVDAISIIESSVSKVRDIRKLLLKQVREYGK